MTRHWKLISGIAGVITLAGLGAGLAIGLSGPNGGPAAASAGLSSAQQVRLEKGLTAPTLAVQAGVVAGEVRAQFEARGKQLLPPGSHLSIEPATFHAISSQLATVDAAVTGPSVSHWQLILVREAGRWQLLGSKKLP
jgi:hypothetical protein